MAHTGTISRNSDNKQVLDKLQVERERGITVKAQTASLFYKYKGETYLLNLIDTPVSASQQSLLTITCQSISHSVNYLPVFNSQSVSCQSVSQSVSESLFGRSVS